MTQNSLSTRAWLPDFVALGALWGASFLFMRWSAPEFGALPMAAVRVTIAALFLLPLMAWQGHAALLRQHWKPILLVGVFNSGLPFALYAFAVMHISTGLAAILNATVPMFGALVAWAWLGERPTAWRSLGLVLGVVGIVWLTLERSGIGQGTADPLAFWAIAACLAATTCYALAASFTKKHVPVVPPLVTAAGSQVGAALALAVPAFWARPSAWPSASAWAAVLAVGVLCTGLAYVLYFRLITRAGPTRTLTVTFLIPVFAVAYGMVLLGEQVSLTMLFCAALVLLGTALSSGLLKPPGQRAQGDSGKP